MKRVAVIAIAGLATGALIAGALVRAADQRDADKRAHYARALFRVAERHVGHDVLVAEWRDEAAKKETP